jgi:D-aspartate ligase
MKAGTESHPLAPGPNDETYAGRPSSALEGAIDTIGGGISGWFRVPHDYKNELRASNTVPALVIRAELNGLGIVRSLVREHIPTIIADTTRRRAAMWSRHCRKLILDQLYGRSFIASLLSFSEQLDVKPVLILTDEMAMRTVSEFRDEMQNAYRFHLPPHHMVTALDNKARFHEFAEQHGLPVPRTVVISEEEHLGRLSELKFPVIVKPADRHMIYLGQVERLHVVFTLGEAKALCLKLLESVGEHIVQERIDGPDSNICFTLFHCGRELNHTDIFTGRKLASYPPSIGSTAICRDAEEVRELLEPLTKKFLKISDYQGLGSLEFKWDQACRRFVIIEPTVGRSDWQEEIATLNGVNLPLAAYRYELGLRPISRTKIKSHVAWQESYLRKAKACNLPSSMRVVDGYWRANDPSPAIFFYTYTVLSKTYKLFKLIYRQFRHPPKINQTVAEQREQAIRQ